jgi:hypothetical protein
LQQGKHIIVQHRGAGIKPVLHHVLPAVAGAALGLSLPLLIGSFGKDLPEPWVFMYENRGAAASLILALAGLLVLLIRFNPSPGQEQQLAALASRAGLVPAGARPHAGENKTGDEILIIGCTGRSFTREGEYPYEELQHCREAKILLLDPREHGALALTRTTLDADVNPPALLDQVHASIAFLRRLRSSQKRVNLKMYPDMPLFKLAIIGDQARVSHYHVSIPVWSMPEFIFENRTCDGGLFFPLHRYFLSRWQDPDIPEYDFDTDELVYRDQLGYEVLREPFDAIGMDREGMPGPEADRKWRYVFR